MAVAASQDTRPRIAVADLEDFIRRAFEAAKYAERRDDMGRLMLAVMMQARNRLAAAEPHQQRIEVPR